MSRDVEAQFFVVSRNEALRAALGREYAGLVEHSVPVRHRRTTTLLLRTAPHPLRVTVVSLRVNGYLACDVVGAFHTQCMRHAQVTLEDFKEPARRVGLGARVAATISRSWM